MSHYGLGMDYEQKGMFTEAIAEIDKAMTLDPENPYPLALLGHTYATSGRRDEARRMLDKLKKMEEQRPIDPIHLVIIYAGLGEKDQAFAWLEKGYEGRWESLLSLKVEPLFGSLRSDPRFTKLLQRMNLSP